MSKKKASAIPTASLEKILKVVQKYLKSPDEIWKALCMRYASKTMSNNLVYAKKNFRNWKGTESISGHIADLETILAHRTK